MSVSKTACSFLKLKTFIRLSKQWVKHAFMQALKNKKRCSGQTTVPAKWPWKYTFCQTMIDDMKEIILTNGCCWLVGCLTSQQHASESQGRICYDNFTCCHTEIEVADPTFHLTQSQYTDTGPTSPSADPITPGRVATGVPIFKSLVTRPRKNPSTSGIRTRDLPLSRRTP